MEEYEKEHFYFQQDGATAFTDRGTRDILRRMFPGRVISLRENYYEMDSKFKSN